MAGAIPAIFAFVRAFVRDAGGNVLMITAGAMTMLLFAVGFGIDYSRSEMMKTKLDAAADAAVLVAVDPAQASQTDTTAQAAAQAMFDSQAAQLSGVTIVSRTVTAATTSQTNSAGVNQLVRNASVTYKATVKTTFASILGASTLTIGGTTSSSATQPPNINFYVAMDASPSMLLPSTTTGLTNIYNVTSCDFACHEQNPQNDGIYVKDANGRQIFLNANYYGTGSGSGVWYALNTGTGALYNSAGTQIGSSGSLSGNSLTYKPTGSWNSTTISGYYADGYWLTGNYATVYPGQSAIDLRVTDETAAAQDLIPFAQSQASSYNVTYQMQLFTFSWTHSGASSPVTAATTMTNVSNLTSSNVPNIYGTQDYWYSNNCPYYGTCNNDQGTEFYNTLANLNSVMATPGTGSASSTPQETLMLITDGMSDENYGAGRTHGPLTSTILAQCTAIKNRGIRIAVLYTQYLPASISYDGWSQSNVLPYISPNDEDLTALQSCASTNSDGSPLLYQVTTGQSISAALQTLFAMVVKTAHLTQ